jgi:hypothetical protein
MAFNQGVRKLIVIDKTTGNYRPCVVCGKTYPLPDAVHIIDQKEWKKALPKDSIVRSTEFRCVLTVIGFLTKCLSLSCTGPS